MDKKDIYEHLAKIYLDASSGKKKKSKISPNTVRNLLLVSLFLAVGFSGFLFFGRHKGNIYRSQIALVLLDDAAKINFHFDPAKKEIYSMDLNHLNLGRYRTIAFSVRKAAHRDNIPLRVEFITSFKEKSEVYVKDIPYKWKDYQINLADFKGIKDWSDITGLTFTVEEWNVKENNGVVYLDNVRLLK